MLAQRFLTAGITIVIATVVIMAYDAGTDIDMNNGSMSRKVPTINVNAQGNVIHNIYLNNNQGDAAIDGYVKSLY